MKDIAADPEEWKRLETERQGKHDRQKSDALDERIP